MLEEESDKEETKSLGRDIRSVTSEDMQLKQNPFPSSIPRCLTPD